MNDLFPNYLLGHLRLSRHLLSCLRVSLDLLDCLHPSQDFQAFSQWTRFLEDGGPVCGPSLGPLLFTFFFHFPSFWAFGPPWSFLTSQVGSSFVKARGPSLLFMEWTSLSHFGPQQTIGTKFCILPLTFSIMVGESKMHAMLLVLKLSFFHSLPFFNLKGTLNK